MTATIRKNIRDALAGLPREERIDLGQLAAEWVTDVGRPTIDSAAIAHSCLVEGVTLEQAGEAGPYASAHQRRAWAAGMLRGAIYQMRQAYRQAEIVRTLVGRIAVLDRLVDQSRVEAKAAWRASGVDATVPFQDPASINRGRVVWAD